MLNLYKWHAGEVPGDAVMMYWTSLPPFLWRLLKQDDSQQLSLVQNLDFKVTKQDLEVGEGIKRNNVMCASASRFFCGLPSRNLGPLQLLASSSYFAGLLVVHIKEDSHRPPPQSAS
eukprot:1158584-Pelagomonas_calceolata.AAC.4